MDRAEVMQVIKTTLLRRGDGKADPIRVVTQYWSLSGDLLAEVDPLPPPPPVARGNKATEVLGCSCPAGSYDRSNVHQAYCPLTKKAIP